MTATILKFPTLRGPAPAPAAPEPVRPEPVFETFGPESALDLQKSARKTREGARELVEFVRANRELARQAGVETVAIEITALCSADHFTRVLDALDDAASGQKPVHVTAEGMALLRTIETLVAEASSNIRRFTGEGSGARLAGLGQAGRSESVPLWIPLILFGVLSIVGIVALASAVGSGSPRPFFRH